MHATVRRGVKPWEGRKAWHEFAVACTKNSEIRIGIQPDNLKTA